MPNVIQVAQYLENPYLNSAPKANREKIQRVIHIYRNNRNVTRKTAEKVVMALYLPSAFGHVGERQTGKGGRDLRGLCKQIPRQRGRVEGEANGDQKELPAEGGALHEG